MTSSRRPIPLRWILPTAQLLLCLIILLPELGFLGFQIHSSMNAYWPSRINNPAAHPHPIVRVVDPDMPLPTAGNEKFRLSLPPLINLPSAFVGLSTWVPKSMLPDFWRAIAFPVVGVIFWIIAGRGIESLLAARFCVLSPSITWVEFAVALALSICCVLLCMGLVVDPSVRDELLFPWRMAFVAAVLWFFLGATIVIGRIVQWQIRRQLRLP